MPQEQARGSPVNTGARVPRCFARSLEAGDYTLLRFATVGSLLSLLLIRGPKLGRAYVRLSPFPPCRAFHHKGKQAPPLASAEGARSRPRSA